MPRKWSVCATITSATSQPKRGLAGRPPPKPSRKGANPCARRLPIPTTQIVQWVLRLGRRTHPGLAGPLAAHQQGLRISAGHLGVRHLPGDDPHHAPPPCRNLDQEASQMPSNGAGDRVGLVDIGRPPCQKSGPAQRLGADHGPRGTRQGDQSGTLLVRHVPAIAPPLVRRRVRRRAGVTLQRY
jgi:hypothetical protein